jgi:general secretion pathway protein G
MFNHSYNPPALRTRVAKGFTLVEILIVVVILGILATIVIPQFSSATHVTRENTLKDELRYLRVQIAVYKAQHEDRYPGSNGSFLDQMTLYTDHFGNTNATYTSVFKYGPYLSRMPSNPLNGLDTIELCDETTSPATLIDGSHGWVYKPSTGEIYCDLAGNDSNGTPYANY